MRCRLCWLVAVLAFSATALAQTVYGPEVAARFPAPAVRLDAPLFKPDRQDFTSNAELAQQIEALLRTEGAGRTRIESVTPGRSHDGVPLHALRFTRGPGRPTVLLIGQQHGDEPAGTEALLILMRELARGGSEVLDKLDVVLLPRANPDGSEWQRRVAASGFDINRDHLLLRTPEARALAALALAHRPVVVVDAHEHTAVGRYLGKFDGIQRHDMLLQYAMTANLPGAIGRASEAWFRQSLLAALKREGLTSEWYYTNSTAPQDLRIAMGGVQPDTSRNVQGLRNTVSILLESRGVGLGRLHLERRVWSHLVSLRSILASAAAHADELVALQRSADAEVAAAACQSRIVVQAGLTPTRRELLFIDPRSGADKAVTVDWDSALELRVLNERSRPCGYWLAAGQAAAAQRLRDLGLRVDTLARDTALQAEAWVEQARGESTRPDVRGSAADADNTIVRVQVALQPQRLEAPAGSFYVPLDQPLANLAVAALEPDSQNSWFANRLLPALDVARRVMVKP